MQIYFKKKTSKPDWLDENAPQIQKYDLLIAGDAEYTKDEESESILTETEKKLKNTRQILKECSERDEEETEETKSKIPFVKNKKNKLVSYQFAAYHTRKKVYLELVLMFYKEKKFLKRPTFEEMMLTIAKELELTPKHLKDIKVLFLAHYSLAEWAHLDLQSRKKLVANETMSLVRKVPISFKPIKLTLIWEKKHWTKLQWEVDWRDTYLIAPDNNKSLDKLSRFTKNKKKDLGKEEKEAIDKLFNEKPEQFIEYALNDVRVCLEYYCKYFAAIHNISKEVYNKPQGVTENYLTVGATTIGMFINECEWRGKKHYNFKKKDELYKKIFGLEKKGKKYKAVYNRKIDEFRAITTYQGGLNAAFYVEHYKDPGKRIYDYDFKGYYPACMSTIAIIDWEKISKKSFSFEQLSKWKLNPQDPYIDAAFFKVHFKYKNKTYQPALPVATDTGIIYPTEGVSFCTWPELLLAYNQGVIIEEEDIEAITLHKWEFKGEVQPAFSWYTQILADLRFKKYNPPQFKKQIEVEGGLENCSRELKEKYEEYTFYYEILKLLANSFYGKLGQGLRRRALKTIEGKETILNDSLITNAYLASLTTGMARAGLVNLINYLHEKGGEIISATTDGCMVALPKEFELKEDNIEEKPSNYPLKIIANAAKPLTGNFLELKRSGDECFSWRTRANSILDNGKRVGIARGNLPAKIIKEEYDLSKYSGKEIVVERLTNAREMHENEADLVMTNIKRTNFYDYDWKRIINKDGKTTRPPKNIEEHYKYKKAQQYYHNLGIEATPELVRQRVETPINKQTHPRTAIRLFLKIALHLEWNKLKNKETVERLNTYLKTTKNEIKIDDLKNWKRERFYTNSIIKNEENEQLLEEIIKIGKFKCPDKWKDIIFINKESTE